MRLPVSRPGSEFGRHRRVGGESVERRADVGFGLGRDQGVFGEQRAERVQFGRRELKSFLRRPDRGPTARRSRARSPNPAGEGGDGVRERGRGAGPVGEPAERGLLARTAALFPRLAAVARAAVGGLLPIGSFVEFADRDSVCLHRVTGVWVLAQALYLQCVITSACSRSTQEGMKFSRVNRSLAAGASNAWSSSARARSVSPVSRATSDAKVKAVSDGSPLTPSASSASATLTSRSVGQPRIFSLSTSNPKTGSPS